jgi:hypothetical protein
METINETQTYHEAQEKAAKTESRCRYTVVLKGTKIVNTFLNTHTSKYVC